MGQFACPATVGARDGGARSRRRAHRGGGFAASKSVVVPMTARRTRSMHLRFAVRLAAGLTVALLALVSVAACGGGHHHHDPLGTLEVANDPTGIETITRIDV